MKSKLDIEQAKFKRFLTGLTHYLYDVAADDGNSFVIRIARPERAVEFKQGLIWHRVIDEIGVQLPKIIEAGEFEGYHFAIYERLLGDDIENVYSSLSIQEKRFLAEEVAEIQRKISIIDQQYFDIILSWKDLVLQIVSRSEREITTNRLCNPKYIRRVINEMKNREEYFQELKPVPFLYDLGVRNVIVYQGKVTGIIDFDELWYGDPLLAIGRGKTILKAMGYDIELIKHWCDTIELSISEIMMVDFYSLLYCLRFMGSIGTVLNGNPSIQTDPKNAELFERMAEELLDRM
jgi:aminoglycoside phosphotransferase (APT) family kinase protein